MCINVSYLDLLEPSTLFAFLAATVTNESNLCVNSWS